MQKTVPGGRDMKMNSLGSSTSAAIGAIAIALLFLGAAGSCLAQAPVVPPLRGVYTPGFSATNSGVLPEPGFTYSNTFMDYSFNEIRCAACGDLASQVNTSVLIDSNLFMWVSKKKILGANFGLAALLSVTNSSISLAGLGPVAGGGGFADSYFQPVTLGWHLKRADITAAYAFFAPTGRFTAGASNNTGSGHWTNTPTAGETFYLTKNRGTAISAYEMYEFHTTQNGTNIHPGQTFDLDYSLTQIIPLQKDMHTLLQVGLVGYGQWQTSNNSGPGVDPQHPGHYKVNGIGGAANIILPARKVALGFKFLKEFSNSYTVQGYSLQITGAITF
jgi:hypothetical protein